MVDPPATKVRRASRPKVKTGCENCKSRRVKCDETRPECQKCVRSARQCGGYPAYKRITNAPISVDDTVPKAESGSGGSSLRPNMMKAGRARLHDLEPVLVSKVYTPAANTGRVLNTSLSDEDNVKFYSTGGQADNASSLYDFEDSLDHWEDESSDGDDPSIQSINARELRTVVKSGEALILDFRPWPRRSMIKGAVALRGAPGIGDRGKAFTWCFATPAKDSRSWRIGDNIVLYTEDYKMISIAERIFDHFRSQGWLGIGHILDRGFERFSRLFPDCVDEFDPSDASFHPIVPAILDISSSEISITPSPRSLFDGVHHFRRWKPLAWPPVGVWEQCQCLQDLASEIELDWFSSLGVNLLANLYVDSVLGLLYHDHVNPFVALGTHLPRPSTIFNFDCTRTFFFRFQPDRNPIVLLYFTLGPGEHSRARFYQSAYFAIQAHLRHRKDIENEYRARSYKPRIKQSEITKLGVVWDTREFRMESMMIQKKLLHKIFEEVRNSDEKLTSKKLSSRGNSAYEYSRRSFAPRRPVTDAKLNMWASEFRLPFKTVTHVLVHELSAGSGKPGTLPWTIRSFWEDFTPQSLHELSPGATQLAWKCKCGYRGVDEFKELTQGATLTFAKEMMGNGYLSHARVSSQAGGALSDLRMKTNNIFVGARRQIRRLRPTALPVFTTPGSGAAIALQCLPTRRCRWLHMCLKKRPYATKLAPLHVCKDKQQNDHNDASFFKALREAYHSQRSWKEKLLFKLAKIEFVEFELCPEDFVDHIVPDKLPPSVDEYDFLPPPPLKKCPPIGAEHMMHLFTSCSAQPQNTSLYLRHIPKRIDKALSFRADVIEGNTGWGLNFVEKLNSSLAVTVLFSISVILGIVFAVCWSILKKDVQGAFGVASYVTSVVTLAVMTWQMWFI